MKRQTMRTTRRMTQPGGWSKATPDQQAEDRRRVSQLGIKELDTQTSKEEAPRTEV